MSVKGIDISAYNRLNSISSITNAGISFAYVKATEGNYYVSPAFKNEAATLSESPLLCGFYHYYRSSVPAREQAEVFLETIATGPKDELRLPAMLDVEDPKVAISATQYIDALGEWLNIVQTATGKAPIIYTGRFYWQQYLENTKAFADHPLWDASYSAIEPKPFGGWEKISFRQYTDKGNVCGLSPVDIDVFHGSYTDLWALSDAALLVPSKVYSPKILALQKELTKQGYNTNGADGYFGNDTLNTLHKYQSANGLANEDEIWPELWMKIFGIKE